jgi:hypothetical protein
MPLLDPNGAPPQATNSAGVWRSGSRPWVKSQGRWIIGMAMHSMPSESDDFRDGEIAAHPEIVDLVPNVATCSEAIIGQLEVFGRA